MSDSQSPYVASRPQPVVVVTSVEVSRYTSDVHVKGSTVTGGVVVGVPSVSQSYVIEYVEFEYVTDSQSPYVASCPQVDVVVTSVSVSRYTSEVHVKGSTVVGGGVVVPGSGDVGGVEGGVPVVEQLSDPLKPGKGW